MGTVQAGAGPALPPARLQAPPGGLHSGRWASPQLPLLQGSGLDDAGLHVAPATGPLLWGWGSPVTGQREGSSSSSSECCLASPQLCRELQQARGSLQPGENWDEAAPHPQAAGHRESHDHPSLGSGPPHTDPCPPSGGVEAWAALALAGSRGHSERCAGAVPAASGPGEGPCCSSEAKSAVSSVTSGLHSHPRLYESLLQLSNVSAWPLRLRLLSMTVPWEPAQIIALMQSRPSSLPRIRKSLAEVNQIPVDVGLADARIIVQHALLMWRVNSLEKTPILGEIEGGRRRGDRG